MIKYWKPLFAVFVWGLSFIATKNALLEVRPEVIVFLRQLLGILFLGAVLIKKRRKFAVNLREQRWIFALAGIACFHLWIQVTGLQWTTASNTGWIIGTTPVYMAILGIIFFKEKITFIQIVGIIIAFFGLVLLVSKADFTTLDFIKNKGDILIIASALTWSVYSMVNKKTTLTLAPVLTIFYLFSIVAIMIAPFAINQQNINAVLNLSLSGWGSILFLGIFCSGVAYTIWAQTLSEMDASRVGAFLYLEPFVTFFGAWILLNEQITFLLLISGLIIIGGVVLVNRK
ncbi:MAG: EamA/RhaT family transporter [Ignavibacteriae bacterium HGW-Ignavibacteriae-3]|nr:MAG: EamA/RhaT family transporter [Ignavibacteriae bacterium HGW-Ignavibacteriae-3]